VLLRRGAPNYFGEQRFGVRGCTHLYGEALLKRDHAGFVRLLLGGDAGVERDPRLVEARRLYDEGRVAQAYEAMPTAHRAEKKCLHALLRFGSTERACASVPKRMRQMYVSAYQSALFNRLAAERVPRLDALERGDLAFLHRTTRVFRVEDPAAEQPRCTAFEISPTAPIFGTRSPLADGAVGEAERRVLAESAIPQEAFAMGSGLAFKGQRRPVRIPIREFSVDEGPAPGTLRFEFVLPSGCFATCVMREITKSDQAAVDAANGDVEEEVAVEE
jgi:tRNA pseudouridine13 synthase